MRRAPDHRHIEGTLVGSGEAGYTLIELLVAMLISLVVLGGGTYGIARALSTSSASTARVTATSNAEVGFERLAVDFRDAVNGTCSYSGATVTGLSIAQTGAAPTGPLTTILLCAPNTNQIVSGSNVPPSEGVQWRCNAGTSVNTGIPAETCVRSVDTGTKTSPAVATNTHIAGILSLTFQGLLNGASTPSNLPCNTTAACGTGTSSTYTLNPGSATSLSWVNLSASVAQLTSGAAGTTQTALGNNPIPLSTGVGLRNFGTS